MDQFVGTLETDCRAALFVGVARVGVTCPPLSAHASIRCSFPQPSAHSRMTSAGRSSLCPGGSNFRCVSDRVVLEGEEKPSRQAVAELPDRLKPIVLGFLLLLSPFVLPAQENPPVELVSTIPLPQLHPGDFDHFVVDVQGKRLFACAVDNSNVLVIDLTKHEVIHTIDDLEAPHSGVYRPDLKKLFVVDGGLGEVKMYDTITYKPAGSIHVRKEANSVTYDPVSKLMYVANGGESAFSYITVINTTTAKVVGEIHTHTRHTEAMAIDGQRLFVNAANDTVEVYDRRDYMLLETWHIAQVGKRPTAMAFDAADHRLFIGTRNPGKLIVLDSESGKVISSFPAAPMVDDMAYSGTDKRIYYAAAGFLDVFQSHGPNHYVRIGHIPTAYHAKTGILADALDRYYLGVGAHAGRKAEILIFRIVP
jgi:DNA-binding beta-propeller fold protein YncE